MFNENKLPLKNWELSKDDPTLTATRWTRLSRPSTRPPRPSPRPAYHPTGLPPAAALPSLTQMADPECKTNLRAQRSFTQVTQLGSWLELMVSAAGLGGEVRGTKVALRECSRLNGVAQPLDQFELRQESPARSTATPVRA